MENFEFQTITLSNVQYNSFKKYNFKYVKSINGFELIDYNDMYNPFEIPDLYNRFANLDSDSIDEISEFIRKYGNIGVIDSRTETYFEKLTFWKEEIKKMRQAILLSEIYECENVKSKLLNLENEFLILQGTYLYEILTFNNPSLDKRLLENIDVFNLRLSCLLDLQKVLETNIGQINFIPFIDLDKDMKPCFKAKIAFPSLLSIMYWQLYMRFYENNRYFICVGCNNKFSWYNHKKNYLCDKCYEQEKYEIRMNNPKKKAHTEFLNRTIYYVSDKKSSCHYISRKDKEKLRLLREKIKDMSLEVQDEMNEENYFKWLREQESKFMQEVEKYKRV